jgi:hypothetical protein
MLIALICGCLFAPHSARAKSKLSASARLELTKGPGTERCLDQQSLARAVELRVQRRAFRLDVPATLYVKIAIVRDRGTWSALLTMHDGSGASLGQRSLVTEAHDCSALDDSLALVVALLVDAPPVPESASQAPQPSTQTTPSAETARNAQPAPSPEVISVAPPEGLPIRLPRDTPAPRQPWRLQLAAEGSGAIGVLPGFAPGIELGFGAKAPTLPELRVFAGWYVEREQRRPAQDAGARFDLGYVGLEICPVEGQFGVTVWFLCAGQSLGRLRVSAFGFDENSTSNHLSYALLVRGGVQLAFASHWAARLGIRAEAPLNRGVFGYGTPDGGQQGLFRPSPIAAVLDLGVVVQL